MYGRVIRTVGAGEAGHSSRGSLTGAKVSHRLFQRLCILRTVQHVSIAQSVGASDEQIAAVEHDSKDDRSLTDVQRVVLRFAREVVLDGAASEQLVADLLARLGERQLVELLLVVGHYMAIARLIATAGLEPDPPLATLTARAEREG